MILDFSRSLCLQFNLRIQSSLKRSRIFSNILSVSSITVFSSTRILQSWMYSESLKSVYWNWKSVRICKDPLQCGRGRKICGANGWGSCILQIVFLGNFFKVFIFQFLGTVCLCHILITNFNRFSYFRMVAMNYRKCLSLYRWFHKGEVLKWHPEF